MRGLLASVACLCLALALGGCYAMNLDEFDSVAGWDDPLTEPTEVDWVQNPKQYPWYAIFVGADPVPAELDNASGFARERLSELIESMGSDLSRIAQVSRRLLWVVEKDPNSLNRIEALRGMELILRQLGSDPLDPEFYFEDAEASEGLRLLARFNAAHETIGKLLGRADRPALTAEQRAAYCGALADYVAEPVPRASWRRKLIRIAWSVFVAESDPEVHAAADRALRRAVTYAVCNGLRAALIPLDETDLPVVRLSTLWIYRRLGGIPAVSFLLRMMTAPEGSTREHRLDRDPQVRRALVRMSAQLEFDQATRGEPRPIEFLYVTAVDEREEDDVRRVALEGLARCLHVYRGEARISLDLDWAKEWWQGYVIDRGPQPPQK